MSSPAAAIVWSIWTRHRTGFMASAATLAALPIVFPLLAAVAPAGTTALASVVPLVPIFAFVLNALLFVEDAGSLSSRYPRHMLTLPVRTRSLAFWPMLLGASVPGLLWVVAALLIYRPAGYHVPVVVPALGVAGLMAWAQALAWMPLGVFWVREVTNIMLVPALGAAAALPVWMTFVAHGSTGLIATVLLVYIVAAMVVAWAAVASERRGQVWRLWPARATLSRIAGPLTFARPRRPFRCPFQAQVWYEWNCHGLMLNGFTGAVLFLIWAVLLIRQGHGTPAWFAMTMVIIPIAVVGMIGATGPGLGGFRPLSSHSRMITVDAFIATRPMTTGRLVAAKFRMSAVSVLLTWALAAAGTAFWVVVSDNLDNVTIVARDFFNRYPGGKGSAIIALACILLPALSWRLLTDTLAPVLSGRRWVNEGGGWLFLLFLAGAGGCGLWLSQRTQFYSALPWLIAGIAILKGAAAVAAYRAALRQGLMSWRTTAGVLTLWLLLTGCGVALAILIGPMPVVPLSWPVLALGVAALVPLVRFPLATLALDWNRHR